MTLPRRKSLPHHVPSWIDPAEEIFFITISCNQRRINSLCRSSIKNALFESVVHRHCTHQWFVKLFLFMPDHIHALLCFPGFSSCIKRTIETWKNRTSRKFRIYWQRGFFEHRIRNEDFYEEKAHYIRYNPVRAGYVNHPSEWKWVLDSEMIQKSLHTPPNQNIISPPIDQR